MKAIQYTTFGGPEVIKFVDTEKPQIKDDEVLKKGGKLYSAAAQLSQELAEKYGVEAKFISPSIIVQNMDYGKKLVEEGKIKPHVVKVMKLEDVAEAQELVSKGGLNGKIVLEIK